MWSAGVQVEAPAARDSLRAGATRPPEAVSSAYGRSLTSYILSYSGLHCSYIALSSGTSSTV